MAFAIAASPAFAATTEIHGRIVAIDRSRGTIQIHHDPHPGMMASMTMQAHLARRSDALRLQRGDLVEAKVDEARDPWLVESVRIVKKAKH